MVNWNNAADTLNCLESLSKVDCGGMRVLVVDNGSTDGSMRLVGERYPQYELLELGHNSGYAGGCNAGARWAVKEGAKYVVFLNNDTVVDPGFIDPLIAPLEQTGDIAVTAPRIFFMEFPERIWYAGGEINIRSGRFAHRGIREKNNHRFEVQRETGYATGCCFAMRAMDFSSLGGYDSSFSMYGEDVDLSLRVRASGKKILYVPESKVWHKISASGGGEMNPVKLWRKNVSLLKLLAKHRAWSGMGFYILLAPFRFVRGVWSVLLFRMCSNTGKVST